MYFVYCVIKVKTTITLRQEVFICHPHCGACSSSVSRKVACLLSPISSRPVCFDKMALSNLGITNAPACVAHTALSDAVLPPVRALRQLPSVGAHTGFLVLLAFDHLELEPPSSPKLSSLHNRGTTTQVRIIVYHMENTVSFTEDGKKGA